MNVTTNAERDADLKDFAGFIVWGVVYLAARLVLEIEGLGWWTRVGVALIPVPLFGWVLWTASRGIAQMDELQRRIQLEALAFAFPLTMLMLMTLGLLEFAVGLNPADWSYRHVWPFVFLFYLAGLVRAKRQYE